MFSFSLLIGGGALLAHLYLYQRWVRKIAPDDRWRRRLGIGLAVVTVLLLFRGPIRDIGPIVEHVYQVVAYSWLAFALCMVLATAAGDVIHLGAAVVARLRPKPPEPTPPAPAALPRRDLLKAVPWGVAAGGGLLTGVGAYRAFTAPEVTTVVVPLAKLPPALDGVSIVQLTDVHVGPFIGRRFMQMLVDAVIAEKPDVVVITGDLVDGDVASLGSAVAELARMRARFGTHFVTGNHEYYSGDLEWTLFLDRLGMTVLRNGRVAIGDGGGVFDLVGVDDWSGGRRRNRPGYDLDAALARRDPERAAVLLAHQPENFEVAAERGIDLQISGHTHGGQVFPMTELVSLKYRYHRGLYRHGDSRLYVSRGCGFWGPPSRIGSPPELVKFVLTTA